MILFLSLLFNPNYSRIILTLLKNLAFCFIIFRKKPVFIMRGCLDPTRKPSRIHKRIRLNQRDSFMNDPS